MPPRQQGTQGTGLVPSGQLPTSTGVVRTHIPQRPAAHHPFRSWRGVGALEGPPARRPDTDPEPAWPALPLRRRPLPTRPPPPRRPSLLYARRARSQPIHFYFLRLLPKDHLQLGLSISFGARFYSRDIDRATGLPCRSTAPIAQLAHSLVRPLTRLRITSPHSPHSPQPWRRRPHHPPAPSPAASTPRQ